MGTHSGILAWIPFCEILKTYTLLCIKYITSERPYCLARWGWGWGREEQSVCRTYIKLTQVALKHIITICKIDS